jgi:hypothetical protein
VALSLAAAAFLWLTAAQAAPTPQGAPEGGDASAAGAQDAESQNVDDLAAPPSMSVAIPGTRTSPTATTAGLDLALVSEVLTQTLQLTGGSAEVETGLIVAPSVAAKVTIPRFAFTLGYNPQLYWVSVTQGPLDTLHRGWVLVDYSVAPDWSLHFAERLTYGTNILTTTATASSTGSIGQQPSTLIPVQVASLSYFYDETSVGLTARLSKRFHFTASVSFLSSGGIGTAAQETMPYEYGPRAQVTLDWTVSPTSTLSSALGSQASFFPVVYASTSTSSTPVSQTGPQIYVTILTETWRVRLSRYTSAWLIAGGAATNAPQLIPVGGLGIESGTRSRQPLTAFVQLLYAPYVDPYLATVYPRLTLTANVSWHPSAKWLLGVAATAAYAPNSGPTTTPTANEYGTAGPTLSFKASKLFSFTAGAYWEWQLANQSENVAPSFNQWGAYLSVTVSDFEKF